MKPFTGKRKGPQSRFGDSIHFVATSDGAPFRACAPALVADEWTHFPVAERHNGLLDHQRCGQGNHSLRRVELIGPWSC